MAGLIRQLYDGFDTDVINKTNAARITVSGSTCTVDAPSGIQVGGYQIGFPSNNLAGRAWHSLASDPYFIRREWRISSLSVASTGNWAFAGVAMGVGIDSLGGGHRYYYFGRHKSSSGEYLKVYDQWNGTTLADVLWSSLSGTPVRLLIYCNRTGSAKTIPEDSYSLPHSHVAFYYSLNGTTWTQAYTAALSIAAVPDQWGIIAYTYHIDDSATAVVDYVESYRYETDQTPPPTSPAVNWKVPLPNAVDVSKQAHVKFRTAQDPHPSGNAGNIQISSASILAKVNGSTVLTGGAFQAGWTRSLLYSNGVGHNGYDVVLVPDPVVLGSDDFEDGVQSLPVIAGNLGSRGTFSESGGELVADQSSGLHADWWTSGRYGNFAYKSFARSAGSALVYFETTFNSWVTANASISRMMFVLRHNEFNHYGIQYDGTNFDFYSAINAGAWTSHGSVALSLPRRIRIVWNVEKRLVGAQYWDGEKWIGYAEFVPQFFDAVQIGFYAKTWSSGPAVTAKWAGLEIAETSALWGDLDTVSVEVSGTNSLSTAFSETWAFTAETESNIHDPSTTFPDTVLPKEWWPHRIQTAPWTGDTISFLSPGVRMDLFGAYLGNDSPTYAGTWAGLLGQGWGHGALHPECDYELTWANLTHEAGSGHQPVRAGIALVANRVLIDDWANRASRWVFVGIRVHQPTGTHRWVIEEFDPYTGPTGTIYEWASSAPVSFPTSGRVRIERTDLYTIKGYYWNGASWVLIGTATDTYLQFYMMWQVAAFGHRSSVLNHGFKWDVTNITKLSGTTIPNGLDMSPADGFDDGIAPLATKWSGPYMGGYGANRITVRRTVAETTLPAEAGMLWYYRTSSVYNFGHASNYVFFPGTDIDVTIDLELSTALGFDHYLGLWFANLGLDDNLNKWVFARLGLELPNTKFHITHAYNAAEVTDANVTLGGSYPHRHTIRITRVGSEWSFYFDGSGTPTATTTDSSGYTVDYPVTMIVAGYGSTDSKVYDITVDLGDWKLVEVVAGEGDLNTRRLLPPYRPVIDLNLVRATLTNQARYLMARGIRDGTSLKPTRFVIGSGWENPRWGEPPVPSADTTDLITPYYEGDVVTEAANEKTLVLRCEGQASIPADIQEVLVYAQIVNSSLPSEQFLEIPFAVATFPTWFHATGQKFVLRVVIPW